MQPYVYGTDLLLFFFYRSLHWKRFLLFLVLQFIPNNLFKKTKKQNHIAFCSYIFTIKVASRAVSLVAGCVFMILGCIGKAAALFATIPDPVLGGLFHVSLGRNVIINE